jgi:uracil-DNA glycosylase
MSSIDSLLNKVRACRICASELPHGVRPVFQIDPRAKILIAGQAPGRKVHESGIAFDDASGDRLRKWMGVTKDEFYNPALFAILPMGFCFPGTAKSGDLPPRPECVPAWREQLLGTLNQLQLTIVLGQYAQDYHFGRSKLSLTELVRSWQTYWPGLIPLPHPSPRNNPWLKRNPWFEAELLPVLRERIASLIS